MKQFTIRTTDTFLMAKMEFTKCSIKWALFAIVVLSCGDFVTGGRGEIFMKSNSVTYVHGTQGVEPIRKSPHERVRRAARISDLDKVVLLNEHNAKRRLEYSSDMEILSWNDKLADMAQMWADGCGWYHGQPDGYPNPPYNQVGQNLYLTTGNLRIEAAMRAWSDNEKVHYTYNTGACTPEKQCGHYTQVVWAKSKEVGCAHAYCRSLVGSSLTNAVYLVCNYGPAGNYAGVKPFQIGAACTDCQSGYMWCDNGLCTSGCSPGNTECQCNAQCQNNGCPTADCRCLCQDGYTGTSCQDNCMNNHKNCGANPGWPQSWCNQYGYVKDNCPLLCGTCRSYTGNIRLCTKTQTTGYATPSTTPVVTTNGVVPVTSKSSCENHYCSNGGTARIDGSQCVCFCLLEWMGPTCEESRSAARNGVILHTSTESIQWGRLVEDLKALIAYTLDNHCYNNAADCCRGQQLPQGDLFSFSGKVYVGATYPHYGEFGGERSTKILFYAKTGTVQGNCIGDLPQDTLYSALYIVRATLDTTTRECCDSILFGLEKPVEKPHRPLPSTLRPTTNFVRPTTRRSSQYPTIYTSGRTTTYPGKGSTITIPDVINVGGNTQNAQNELDLPIPIWLMVFIGVLVLGVLFAVGFSVFYKRRSRRLPSSSTPPLDTLDDEPPPGYEPEKKKKHKVKFLPRSPKSILKRAGSKKSNEPPEDEIGSVEKTVKEKIVAFDSAYYNY